MREVKWKSRNGTMVCHCIYTKSEADILGLRYIDDWREANIGDWVLTDDDHVVEILRKYTNLKHCSIILGTCTTQVNAKVKSHKLDVEKKVSRYTIGGGKRKPKKFRMPKNLNAGMLQFCLMVASGRDPYEAYIKAIYKKNTGKDVLNGYIATKVNRLMAQPNIQEQITSHMGTMLEEEGLTKRWILQQYKRIILHGDKDAPKVVALNKLSQFQGMDDMPAEQEQLPQLPEGVLSKFLETPGETVAETEETTNVEEQTVSLPDNDVPTGNDALIDCERTSADT